VFQGVFCVGNGSGLAEKWTSVSPWMAALTLGAIVEEGEEEEASDEEDEDHAQVGRCRLPLSNPR